MQAALQSFFEADVKYVLPESVHAVVLSLVFLLLLVRVYSQSVPVLAPSSAAVAREDEPLDEEVSSYSSAIKTASGDFIVTESLLPSSIGVNTDTSSGSNTSVLKARTATFVFFCETPVASCISISKFPSSSLKPEYGHANSSPVTSISKISSELLLSKSFRIVTY